MYEDEDIVRRLDRRDGFRVVTYSRVGIPVFRINCAFTIQETSEVGAIEEFTLRSISEGVDKLVDLVKFLGLPLKVVASQLGRLVYEGLLATAAEDEPRYCLTPAGRARMAGANTAVTLRQRMPIYLDGITRKLIELQPQDLWTAEQLEALGVASIAPGSRRAPQSRDIDLAQVNNIVSNAAGQDGPKRRAVRLDALVGRANLHFQRALAIAFKSDDGKRVSIAFAIDGRPSEEHEIDYERSGAARKAPLFASLFDPDKRRREAQAVNRELKQDFKVDGEGAAHRPLLRLERASEPVLVSKARVRVLSVYEHPPLLQQALTQSKTRLLIVSPWIRANVVGDAFIKSLAACLDRGVAVTIAYGIGKSDPGERNRDVRAREYLESLQKTFVDFSLVKRGNTHAKVLLMDSVFFVTSSFNWLSFNGDPRLPLREEEGTLIEDPEAVDAYYSRYVARLKGVV
jgi:hypothetical protein